MAAKYSIFDQIFLYLSGISIILGGMGIFKATAIPLSVALCFAFLGIKTLQGYSINIAPTFWLHIAFLLALLISSIFFDGEIIYFWMFLSGGLFWLVIENFFLHLSKYLPPFILVVALIMTATHFLLRLNGIDTLSPDNLFLPIEKQVIHNHLGDLWAIAILPVIYTILRSGGKWYLFAVSVLGLIMVGLSYSRSAIAVLVLGFWYLISKIQAEKKTIKNTRYLRTVEITILVSIFAVLIYFSTTKSLFFSRPYYIESLISIIKNPLGIGMGNFDMVSRETNNVHNVVLEVINGLGILGVFFIIFLLKAIQALFYKNTNIAAATIWIGIFANFLFDSTYVIPGLLWIWYISFAYLKTPGST